MKDQALRVHDPLYFRFLGLSRSLMPAFGNTLMSPSENQLLEEVAWRALENNAMSVREAIGLSHLGSPATLHKKLRRLRNLELLAVERKDHDRRSKYLIATPLALMYFERWGRAMQSALSAKVNPT